MCVPRPGLCCSNHVLRRGSYGAVGLSDTHVRLKFRCHGFVLEDADVYDCERSGCVVMEVALLMARCPPWLVVVTLSQHHSNCSVELRSVCHAHDTGFVVCEKVFQGVMV